MKIDTRGLNLCLTEYNTLSAKVRHTPHENKRMAYLQTAISAIKAGATLAELDQEHANETLRANGLPEIETASLEARQLRELVERRDMVEGAPMISQVGTYSGLGFFVPTGFFPKVFAALAARDVLFNQEDCSVIFTDNGRVLPVPTLGDIENVASVIGEAGDRSIASISAPGHVKLGAYTYDSKRWVVSIEAVQDVQGALNLMAIARDVFSSRLVRGIGRDLLSGDGSSKPTGLLTQLSNIGVPPIHATGSVVNDGNAAHNGVATLGSDDFQAAIAAIDSAYLESPKAAWIMNRRTLAAVANIKSSTGQPIGLVQYVDGKPFILGIPAKVSPSMPDMGASNVSVILGDFQYWLTRLVVSGENNIGLKTYFEGPGLAENGNVAVNCFVRADGALLYTDNGSPAPFQPIQHHS